MGIALWKGNGRDGIYKFILRLYRNILFVYVVYLVYYRKEIAAKSL